MQLTMKQLFKARQREGFDYAISLSRIVGMLFIVACHIANYYENAVVSQIFNVGVPMFFIISGMLYSEREISEPASWLKGRLLRLYMPLLAWTMFLLVIALIQQGRSLDQSTVRSLLLLSVNLQGLRHLFPGFPAVDGPWFFTVIMLCYVLLIPWKKLEKKYPRINSIYTIFVLAVFTAFMSRGGLHFRTLFPSSVDMY